MKKLTLTLIFLIQTLLMFGQSFPVRVTPQAIPPYPTNIAGYANSNSSHSPLRLQLVLNDINVASRSVRLKASIEGNGISAISAPVIIGSTPIVLDSGIPVNLDNNDLAPYFELQNLQGVNPTQYSNTLPNGTYRICFEVIHTLNNNTLSDKRCATVFLNFNEPPFLNLPENQSSIIQQDQTNIIFQWTPRHINVPNVAYEFSLVEIWDRYIDPQAIFLSSPPLYQEVTTNTTLLYGPTYPPLLDDKRYAWRVRAFVTNDLGEELISSPFMNNGNSEIFWFDHLGQCDAPQSVTVQEATTTGATINWIGHAKHLDYTIHYRELGSQQWYKKRTPREYITIDEFKPDTQYQYKIVGHCSEISFGESESYIFKTQSEEEAEMTQCGINPDDVALESTDPITSITETDVFTAGDFPIYIQELTSPSGGGAVNGVGISGEGYISTPWLATVRIPVTFDNIKINKELQLMEGEVITTYDPNWGSIIDADDIIEEIIGDGGDIAVIQVDADIENVVVNDDGTVTIVTANGIEINQPGGSDTMYVDSNGEVWNVSESGEVTQGQMAEGGAATPDNTNGISGDGVEQITSADVTVLFTKGNGYYAFDTLPQNANQELASNYKGVDKPDGSKYYPPYKAIAKLPQQQSDFIEAVATFNTTEYTTDDIVFKTKQGEQISASWSGNTATLSIKKSFDFAKQQILATIKPKTEGEGQKYDIAGVANLWHLGVEEVKDINVQLISVNGASLNGIAEQINQVYHPAGIHFNVTPAPALELTDNIWDLNGNGMLDIGDSGLLDYYTDEQQAIRTFFKAQGTYKKDTYYVFVMDLPTSNPDTQGFMPLKQQYGFVFSSEHAGRTAAHELGHGVFGLEHPFSTYNTGQGVTEYLMDYGQGTQLSHMDWEQMFAPGIQLYQFQDDEDGEFYTDKGSLSEQFLNPDRKSFTLITPAGKYINLPREAQNITFALSISDFILEKNIVTGTLLSFQIGPVVYKRDLTIENEKVFFKGYKSPEGKYYSNSEISKNLVKLDSDGYQDAVVIVIPYTEGIETIKFRAKNLIPHTAKKQEITGENQFPVKLYSPTNPEVTSLKRSFNDIGSNNPEYSSKLIEYLQILNTDFLNSERSHIKKTSILAALKIILLANNYENLFLDFTNCFKQGTNNDCGIKEIQFTDQFSYYNSVLHIFTNYIFDNRLKFANYLERLSNTEGKENLTNQFNSSEILTAINNLFNNDLTLINPRTKAKAISFIVDDFTALDDKENQLIRLIKNTSNPDIDDLFQYLKGKSFIKDADENIFLLKELTSSIDNDHIFFTEDNYLEFIQMLTELALKSDKFKEQALAYDDEELMQHVINFYHRGFWDSVTVGLTSDGSLSYKNCQPDTKVEWVSENSTNLRIENNLHCEWFHSQNQKTLELDPFAPIMFVNKSSLSMLSDYNKGNPTIAPAYTTYYADDIGNSRNIVDGIQAAVDVLSIASGYGALMRGPSALRKAFIVSDMIGSGASLTLGAATDHLSPKTKALLESLNILTAIVSIGEIPSGVSDFASLFKKVKTNTNELPSIKQVDNFLDKLLDGDLKPEEIAELGVDKINEAKVWLKNIEAEKVISNSGNLAIKAKQARAKIKLVEKILSIDKDVISGGLVLDLAEDVTNGQEIINKAKNFITTNDDFVDIIVHADDVGNGFSIIMEIDNITQTINMTAKEFSDVLKLIPEYKTIRLLSCNTTDAAQEIAKILKRDIVGSHGEMKLYQNGHVEAGKWYKAKANGDIQELPKSHTGSSPAGDYITLKKKFVDKLDEGIKNELKNLFRGRYTEFIDMLTRSALPGTWKIQKKGSTLILVDKNGKEWAEILSDRIKAIGGTTGNGWNPLLNIDPPLLKNFRYEVDNGRFIYETDYSGRVSKIVDTDVRYDTPYSGRRNGDIQANAKNVKNGEATDDGGHMISAESGGPLEQINYFPQHPEFNQTGKWRKMEIALKKLKDENPGETFKLEIVPVFLGSKRPSEFFVTIYKGNVDVTPEGYSIIKNPRPNAQ